jgi:hypothetical protein
MLARETEYGRVSATAAAWKRKKKGRRKSAPQVPKEEDEDKEDILSMPSGSNLAISVPGVAKVFGAKT